VEEWKIPPPDWTDFWGQRGKVFSAFSDLYRHSALGTLVKGIVHNLNGSLQILSMQLELLQRTISKDGTPLSTLPHEKVERCLGQIDKMRTILEVLSRRGSEGGASQTVHVNDLIDEELSFLNHHLFFKHEIDVKKAFGLRLPPLQGSLADLRTGLMNLFLNAIEAMENSPKKELTVKTEFEAGALRILIRDTGCGIPEGIRPQLFNPFFTTKGEGHYGLGLFMTRQLLTPWKGTIGFSSADGETIFSMAFPVSPLG
jgi:signal transduction histidine kinase